MSPFYVSFVPQCYWKRLPFLKSCFQCMLISDAYNSDYLLRHLLKVILFLRVIAHWDKMVCWSVITMKEDLNYKYAKMLRNWVGKSVQSTHLTNKGYKFWKEIACSHRKYRKNSYLLCMCFYEAIAVCAAKRKNYKKLRKRNKQPDVLKSNSLICMEKRKEVTSKPLEASLVSYTEIRNMMKALYLHNNETGLHMCFDKY